MNGGIGFPAGLEQIVDALSLVPRGEVGMVAAARAAGIGKDEDALFIVHEGLRFGEIGRWRAVLEEE
ncbi:MAG: hypothetical protein LRY50_06330 [Geovibrio sp.]|nr:hypothetical protein [Geovibrio sp.]